MVITQASSLAVQTAAEKRDHYSHEADPVREVREEVVTVPEHLVDPDQPRESATQKHGQHLGTTDQELHVEAVGTIAQDFNIPGRAWYLVVVPVQDLEVLE